MTKRAAQSNAAKATAAAVAASVATFIALAVVPGLAAAQVKIGVTVSETGPQASLGIPEKNAVTLLPTHIGGKTVQYIVLDDASDTNRAVTNTRKLTSEDNVDLIIGSSTTPNTLAMINVAAAAHTPVISLASSARLVAPVEGDRRWIFKTPHSDSQMASAITTFAAAKGSKSLAFIGFNNALGDSFYDEVRLAAPKSNLSMVANERYSPTDTSVTAQALKIIAAKPDAVVIGASGTPAALPARALRQLGYKGALYFNHGVSNADFVRLCGADCEGAYVPTGPVMVATQLPDSSPLKASAVDFTKRYEHAFGPGSISLFSAYSWAIGLQLQQAIPVALKTAQPGTPEFRGALRDALESIHDLPTPTGIFNTSATDHVGLDDRSRVMAQIVKGKWKLAN